ncbi:MAG: cation diffusion facilitator family transporter [Candidatus Cryptobacteroides sp.]
MKTHEHTHGHIHEHSSVGARPGILLIALLVNLAFVAAEAIVGRWSNSTGLLSDAGHNLSDALGLLLSLIAVQVESRGGRDSKKVSRYVTLANAAILMLAVLMILFESLDKILNPVEVNGSAVIVTSAVAIFINGFTALLLMKGGRGDINIRAAFLHAASDTLVSVAVVASGIVIRFTGWNLIDPLLGLLVTLVIAVPTVRLIAGTVRDIRSIA